jgi:glycosyltransferase involved in cell wall biosynthesis
MSKPFRIGLVMQGGNGWMGGVEYIKNIVFALSTLPEDVKDKFEICLICDPALDHNLYESIIQHLSNVFYLEPNNLLTKIKSKIQRIGKSENYPRLVSFLKNNQIEINFLYPYFSLNYNPCSNAEWIPDFQHKYLPDYFTDKDIVVRNKLFETVAKYSPKIVVSSESSKSDIFKFFPDSTNKKVEVLSFTTFPLDSWYTDNPEEAISQYDLPSKYFLVSNQFWPHKNHDVVFRAIKLLQERDIYINIVFTGKIDDSEYSQSILKTINEFHLSDRVSLLGLIPKDHQVQLIRTCIAMIQPSLFEGWSTVVEDARCFGKHIALSDLPVHLEQNPPDAVFFARSEPVQLAEILEKWWYQLEAGIDLVNEAAARQTNQQTIQSFAYQFLSIAGVETGYQ